MAGAVAAAAAALARGAVAMSSSQSVLGDPYTRVKQLGQGSFGWVMLVRDERDGQLYVMKEVRSEKRRKINRARRVRQCCAVATATATATHADWLTGLLACLRLLSCFSFVRLICISSAQRARKRR